MKIFKSRIFIFLLGLLITSGVVYAATTASESISYGNGTVKDALDYLYSAPQIQKICEYQDSTYGDSNNIYSIGTKYKCYVNSNQFYYFYVLAVNNEQVKLIMDKNITQGTSTTTMTWANAMKYIKNNSLKTNWSNVLDVDLPIAKDVANAVGNTGWNMEDRNYDGWFYFDPSNGTYGQTQVAKASNLSNYRWLYNYTRECSTYGCDAATSLGAGEAYGYWTRDIVAQQKDSTGRAWGVGREGYLGYGTVSNDTNRGVRPVITVLKANLYKNN